MTLTNQDIPTEPGDFIAGDTLVAIVHVTDDDGTDYDLSAVTAVDFVLATRRGGTPVVSKALGDGVTITDAAGGLLRVVVESAETLSLAGNYHHETRVTEPSRVATVSVGSLYVTARTA
jgi:hypothetical protein